MKQNRKCRVCGDNEYTYLHSALYICNNCRIVYYFHGVDLDKP